MRAHIDIRELITHAGGSLPEKKRAEIDEHLSSCGECAAKAEAVRQILARPSAESAQPSPALEYRIRSMYRTIADNKPGRRSAAVFQKMLKPAAAFLLIGVTAAASLLYLRSNRDTVPYPIPLSSKVISGSLTVNNAASPRLSLLRHNSLLRTGNQSVSKIYLGNRFAIRMAEKTNLGITSSVFIPKTGKYRFNFHLHDGTVHASFHNRTSRMEYTFSTPEASIESTGTEFLLTSSRGKTSLVLVRGRTRITSRLTGASIEAAPGSMYTIGSTITASRIQRHMAEAVYALREVDAPGIKMPGFLFNGKHLKRHGEKAERMIGEAERADKIRALPDAAVQSVVDPRPAKRHYSIIEEDDGDNETATP